MGHRPGGRSTTPPTGSPPRSCCPMSWVQLRSQRARGLARFARAMGAVGIEAMGIDAARGGGPPCRFSGGAQGLSVPTSLPAIGPARRIFPHSPPSLGRRLCRGQPPRGEVGGRCRAVHSRVLDRADGPVAGPGTQRQRPTSPRRRLGPGAPRGRGPASRTSRTAGVAGYADESRTTSSGWNRTCW